MKQKKISKRTWKNKEFIFVKKITQTRNHLLNLILVNLPVSVTTSVSTLTSTLGWASHLLLSLSFLKAEVVVFFSSVMLLSFLFLRVTNQVPALSEVKIEGNRNNLGANLKDKKKSAKIRIFRHNWISYCSGSLERLIFLKAARGSFLLVDDLTSHWSKSEASKMEVGIFIVRVWKRNVEVQSLVWQLWLKKKSRVPVPELTLKINLGWLEFQKSK